jgi:hypothetical protein
MAETPPLGVNQILSGAFELLGARLGKVIGIGFVIGLIVTVAAILILGPQLALGLGPPEELEPGQPPELPGVGEAIGLFAVSILQLVGYALTSAALILLAFDARVGRDRPVSDYLAGALVNVVPVIALSVAVGVMVAVGLMLLIVPGIWLVAVFSVFVPVIVLEQAGFSALGRSAALTRDYRWSIVGLGLVLYLIVIVVSLVVGLPLALLGVAAGEPGPLGIGVAVLLDALASAIFAGYGAMVAALLYARLRQLKEGITLEDLSARR